MGDSQAAKMLQQFCSIINVFIIGDPFLGKPISSSWNGPGYMISGTRTLPMGGGSKFWLGVWIQGTIGNSSGELQGVDYCSCGSVQGTTGNAYGMVWCSILSGCSKDTGSSIFVGPTAYS